VSADDIMTMLRRHTLTRFHVRLRCGREHYTAADGRRGRCSHASRHFQHPELSAEASNGEVMPPLLAKSPVDVRTRLCTRQSGDHETDVVWMIEGRRLPSGKPEFATPDARDSPLQQDGQPRRTTTEHAVHLPITRTSSSEASLLATSLLDLKVHTTLRSRPTSW